MTKVIVLDGGCAGVLVTLEVKVRFPSVDILVIDKSPYYERGGLLHSEVIQNHVFDVGVLTLYSHIILNVLRRILTF